VVLPSLTESFYFGFTATSLAPAPTSRRQRHHDAANLHPKSSLPPRAELQDDPRRHRRDGTRRRRVPSPEVAHPPGRATPPPQQVVPDKETGSTITAAILTCGGSRAADLVARGVDPARPQVDPVRPRVDPVAGAMDAAATATSNESTRARGVKKRGRKGWWCPSAAFLAIARALELALVGVAARGGYVFARAAPGKQHGGRSSTVRPCLFLTFFYPFSVQLLIISLLLGQRQARFGGGAGAAATSAPPSQPRHARRRSRGRGFQIRHRRREPKRNYLHSARQGPRRPARRRELGHLPTYTMWGSANERMEEGRVAQRRQGHGACRAAQYTQLRWRSPSTISRSGRLMVICSEGKVPLAGC
jgi:hypothetical protein